jgi:hypothetical protein
VIVISVALWRSGAVAKLAAVLLSVFIVLDSAGQGLVAHAIALVATTWIALSVAMARPENRAPVPVES